MQPVRARFIGVELYFDDLEKAKKFYEETLGLTVSDEQAGHHAQFDSGGRFICLERKGAESYPSKDKAVLFFEVASLKSVIAEIGHEDRSLRTNVGRFTRSRGPQCSPASEGGSEAEVGACGYCRSREETWAHLNDAPDGVRFTAPIRAALLATPYPRKTVASSSG